ncbi:hypothetical protein EI94DRAFT_1663924 [Lactarius quietus]|nr:hypothetical protein EI94DRAFT_1663924 [Lactarius quietus]
MDSIFAITLGVALRLVVDATSHHNNRISGSLVGLWEGAVLYHFLEKWPSSVDPYVGLGFRLFVDFLLTESVQCLAIVLLWTGLGFIISDVTPAFWYDKNLHRFYRRTRRFIRHFDWNSLKIPLPSSAISRVRFYDIPSFGPPATTSASASASTSAPSAPAPRRPSVPGNFPGSSSSTDASNPPIFTVHRPVPATSVPQSALRSGSRSKPSSSSSVSFEVGPPTPDLPALDDDDLFVHPGSGARTPKPVPPPIVMPVPDLSRTASGDPASSTLPPANIDSLPEIDDPRDDDPDPPPPFVERPDDTSLQPQPRHWSAEKLSVRNPDEDSPRASIISGGNRNSIIIRADLLREQANAEEKARDRLRAEQKKALAEKRYADAVKYKVEQDEASERAMTLHRRAADRFFKAHNLQPEDEHTIDVHRLQSAEATRKTEIAIRDALLAGASRLRVICGRESHSRGKIPVLRHALIGAMERHKIDAEVDPGNPGVINIKLPVS